MTSSSLLIASANGLGHARRLFYIHHEFLKQGIDSELVVNTFQFDKCKIEFPKKTLDKVLISNAKFGLDGPHATFNEKEDSDAILRKICKAENILSDNLIWPASFNPNVFIHGHFTWVDYWRKIRDTQSIAPSPEFEFEESLEKKIMAWFASTKFIFPQSFLTSKLIPMPLIRYPNDINFETFERNWTEIWVSVGTTRDEAFSGLDSTLETLKNLGYRIRRQETNRFHDFRTLPGLVIGRPGLGTIRDCLASGTAFLPVRNDNQSNIDDPELSSNLRVLSKFGLLSSLESISAGKLQQISELYLAFWIENSCPISDYSNRILQLISEKRN